VRHLFEFCADIIDPGRVVYLVLNINQNFTYCVTIMLKLIIFSPLLRALAYLGPAHTGHVEIQNLPAVMFGKLLSRLAVKIESYCDKGESHPIQSPMRAVFVPDGDWKIL